MTSYLVRTFPVWLLVFAAALAGCEDPSNVGLGIIGEEGSEPQRLELGGVKLPDERSAPVTGGLRIGSSYSGPGRYLVGIVDDPVFGKVDAKSYIDFSTPLSQPEGFRDGTVTQVILILERGTYVYGDTTLSNQLVVSNMDVAWPAFGTRSDTTMTSGESVISVEYRSRQDDLLIQLPQEWIDAHGQELLAEDFVEDFNGFEVASTTVGTVSGFLGLSSSMRVTTTNGSADYPMSKIVTTIDKEPGPGVDGRTILQDGFGENAILDFGFEVDSISAAAISRAVVEARIDLSAFEDLPDNFIRPIPTQVDLIGIQPNGIRRVLRSAVIQTEGRVRFVSSSATPGEFTLVRSVQLAVTGNSIFEKYAIAVTEAQAAIVSALLYNGDGVEDSPSATITYVPTPFAP